MSYQGILFAVIAMVSWGIGDYFIQKSSRLLGIWKSIFFISITGIIGLAPFVFHDLRHLAGSRSVLFIVLAVLTMMVASVFDFEALRQGKLAIMEPIISTELPIASLLAVLLWGESLSVLGWILILVIFFGTTLAVTEHHTHLHYHKRIFEKGVIFALTAALCMALLDVVMGASSQTSSPLLTVWLVWVGTGVISFSYLSAQKKTKEIWKDLCCHPKTLLALGILDTLGWIGFCLASAHIPIAFATAIAESYIAITIGIGVFINREKLRWHQTVGVVIVFAAVIILTVMG